MERSESFQQSPASDGEQPTDRPLRVAHLIVGLARAGAETALLRLILDTRGTVQHHVVGMTSECALASAMRDAGARTTMSCGTQRCFASSSPQSFSRGEICQSASINHRKRELSPRQSSRRSLPTMECVVKRACCNRQVIQFSQSYHRRQLSQETHAQSALHSIAVGRSFGM